MSKEGCSEALQCIPNALVSGTMHNVSGTAILLVKCIFNGDGVVTLADFTAFLHFALALL
jgi:hypothetical protein